MSAPEPPLTRKDLAEVMAQEVPIIVRPIITEIVSEVVSEVVSEIVGDALNLINDRFDIQDRKIDKLIKEVKAMNDWLGDHELRIRLLERASPSV